MVRGKIVYIYKGQNLKKKISGTKLIEPIVEELNSDQGQNEKKS